MSDGLASGSVGIADLNAMSVPDVCEALGARAAAARLASIAREEDLVWAGAEGDVTSLALGGEGGTTRARVVCRENSMTAGVALLGALADGFGGGVTVEPLVEDGVRVERGAPVAILEGPAEGVLTLERTLLNLLSYLFGVATTTQIFVRAAASGDAHARVLDTRKTLPGYRAVSKYAVRCGGGWVHRVNLADAVLLKDNHIAKIPDADLGPFIEGVASRARADRAVRFVEVEVDRLSQLASVLSLPRGVVDYVLLDNMGNDMLRDAVAMRNATRSAIELEASGGMTLDRMASVAATGVERISVGGLTQRSVAVDIGLDADV